jgi:hypothetical protein
MRTRKLRFVSGHANRGLRVVRGRGVHGGVLRITACDCRHRRQLGSQIRIDPRGRTKRHLLVRAVVPNQQLHPAERHPGLDLLSGDRGCDSNLWHCGRRSRGPQSEERGIGWLDSRYHPGKATRMKRPASRRPGAEQRNPLMVEGMTDGPTPDSRGAGAVMGLAYS